MQSTQSIRQIEEVQVTLLAEVLAAVQPSSVDDLLDLAALVGDVEAGRLTVQTAVTA